MKLNVMKAKPQITDEEIQSYMDFEGLIAKHKADASFFSKGRIISLIAIVTFVGAVVYFFIKKPESTATEANQVESQPPNQKTNLPESSNADLKVKVNDSLEAHKFIQQADSPKAKQGNVLTVVNDKNIENKTETEQIKDVFIEAEPIDGFPKLYNFFNQNIKYPESNLKEKIEGVEIISFLIDENGKVGNPKVVKSLGQSFDAEALRLVNSMPKWKAATLNGRPVPSTLSLPFTFSIKK